MSADWVQDAMVRVELATPGPWEALLIRDGESERSRGVAQKGRPLDPIVETDDGVYGPDREDAVFIAAARTDLPRALACVCHADDLVTALEAMHAGCGSGEKVKNAMMRYLDARRAPQPTEPCANADCPVGCPPVGDNPNCKAFMGGA